MLRTIVTFSGCLLGGVAVMLVAAPRLTAQPAKRYVVTASPIDVGVVTGDLCIAVDRLDQHGVWWWQPGRSGCSTRSTGPGVFHAEEATVLPATPSGAIEVGFRMPVHSLTSPFADVRLVLESGTIRAVASGERVPTEARNDLEIPEAP